MALGLLLRRKIGGYDIRGVVWVVVRVTIASVVGGAAAYLLVAGMSGLADSALGFLVQLAIGGIAGLAIAYGLSALFRVREVSDGFTMLHRVFSRAFGRSGGAS